MFRFAIRPPASGGQSRLVTPKIACEPLPSQVSPERAPLEQVPPLEPSFGIGSPEQTGHGSLSVGPLYTLESSAALPALDPLSTFAVPLMPPLNVFTTQVETPPAARGRFVPKKNA